jgi:hypothetical protein
MIRFGVTAQRKALHPPSASAGLFIYIPRQSKLGSVYK